MPAPGTRRIAILSVGIVSSPKKRGDPRVDEVPKPPPRTDGIKSEWVAGSFRNDDFRPLDYPHRQDVAR